jgi:hypothetical protein
MHPQLRPLMQPPGSGSGASLAGTTGRAPPPVRPPGSSGDKGISLDEALVAGLSGVAALGCAATAAPHPTIKANRPVLARSAIVLLPSLVITLATTAGTGVGGHRSYGHQWLHGCFPFLSKFRLRQEMN